MSTSEQTEDQINELPPELGEYKRRIMVLDDLVVIEYSKRQLFIRYIHPDSIPSDEVESSLLFDVIASTVEEAVEKMKPKVKKYQDSHKD